MFEKDQLVEQPSTPERRTFLKQVAAAAVVAGTAGTVFAEPTTTLQRGTGGDGASPVQDIELRYDESTYSVTVTPSTITKGTTIRFVNPDGGKVRVVFLTPRGNESDAVLDSESCTMSTGGIFPFKCFFLPKGATKEISVATGGGVEVLPHRP